MKNFGKIISDKDVITKEYLDSKGYISAITSKMVTDALGFTPFDSAAFTKTSIKNALGIADWALAANKPSYDDVYLKLTGGTITGNLTVNGKVSASGLSISTATASLTFTDNIIYSNASLKIYGGWSLRLGANGTGIQEWTDLKTILGLGSLAYKNSIEASDISAIAWSKVTGKPTTLSGYGITDAYTKGTADSTFLKLSGGTMTNGAGIYNAANSNKSEGAIGFNSNHNAFGSTTFATIIRSSINPTVKLPSGEFAMLHSGNFGDFNLVVWSNNIDVSSNSSFKHIGSANANNGWTSVGGPAMAFGANGSNYVKLIFPNYNDYYQRRIYYKHIKGGVEATSWGEIITKDNFSEYGLAIKSSTASWKPTDSGAYIGYTTGINGWATAGIAVALAAGNYSGLLNFAGGTEGSVELFVSNYHNGAMRAWEKVLTNKSIGTTSLPSLNLNGRTITDWDAVSEMTSYVVVRTSSTPTFTLRPNQKHTIANFSEYTSVEFVLDDVTAGTSKVKFYYIEFIVGTNIPSISFNKTLKWQNGKGISNIVANKTYRIFIDDDLATLETY